MTTTGAALLSRVDWDAITGRLPFVLDAGAVGWRVEGRVVMITGAAGSLGAPLARSLAAFGIERLVLFDHHEGSLFHLREEISAALPRLAVRAVLGDVRSGRRLSRVLEDERPDLVYHLAAYKHVPWGEEDPEAFVEANVLGSRTLVDAATAAGVEHVVYPSTDKAIDPPSLYGATKRLVEMMLYAAAGSGGPRCTIVRFVNVLGSRGSAPETFARQIAEGRPLTVTDTRMRRYWITPDHARLLLLHAACVEERAATVAPDAGEETPVMEIARRMLRVLRPEQVEPSIAVTGLRPGERLSEPITAPHERLEGHHLPGVVAVRGVRGAEPRSVGREVDRLRTLVEAGADPVEIRCAVVDAIRTLQSRSPDA